jgi:TIR domain/Helix-turn-helix domain
VSVEALSWAFNLAPVPSDAGGKPNSACAFVLAGLANHAGPDGTAAFPSVDTLVRYTRLSERTVRTALDRLEAAGVIAPCAPEIVAAHIWRADRRPQGWNLDLSRVRDDLTDEDVTALERQFPGLRGRVLAARAAAGTPPDGVQPLGPAAAPVDNRPDGVQPLHPATGTGCNQRTNGVQLTQERGAAIAPEPSIEPSTKPPAAARAGTRETGPRAENPPGGGAPGEFFGALGPGWLLTARQRARLVPAVSDAVAAGWDPVALAAFVGANCAGVRSPYAILAARLSPGELPVPHEPAPRRKPWCGHCDPDTRFLLDERGLPADHPRRCPRCGPAPDRKHQARASGTSEESSWPRRQHVGAKRRLRCADGRARRASLVSVDGGASAVRAFLSHASEDKAGFVEPLARELAEMGVAPWLDIWEISPGDSLVKKLFEEGLDTVGAVIVVVSASSAAKPWVREELDASVVRRITGSMRLIPVWLDDAPIPAPLQHLVWISADRTSERIRSAAEQITDALYARDKRPAVAPPPAYTAAAAIPGLAQADSALLAVLIEEALDAEILIVNWPAARAKAEEQGMTPSAIDEAFAALQNRRYLKIRSIAGGPHTVELSTTAFRQGVDAVVPDAEVARRQVIATLVNNPLVGDRQAHELAALTGKPTLFVVQFLKQLGRQGDVQISQFLGGFSRITVSPTLRRLL